MNGLATLLLTCTLSVSCWFDTINYKGDAEKALQTPTPYQQAGALLSQNPSPQLYRASFAPEKRDDDPNVQYRLCAQNYEEHDIATAIKWCKKAALNGHMEAQYALGSIYMFGDDSTEDDYKKAEQWLVKAAEQGYAPAAANLGMLYIHGLAGTQDTLLAKKWLQNAVEEGYAPAELYLGNIYARGSEGIEQDFLKAADLYERAAIQGDATAQHNLSVMFLYGYGVEKDIGATFFWTRKAAENEHLEAQYNLGMMYYFGSGTEINDEQAIKWLTTAAMAGDIDAQLQLGYMYFYRVSIGEMTPEESITMAYMYYSMAAKQQNAEAIHHVAQIESYLGEGPLQSIQTAAQALQNEK